MDRWTRSLLTLFTLVSIRDLVTTTGHVTSVASVTRCRVLATRVSLTTDLLLPLELQFWEISDKFLFLPGPGPGGDHVASVTRTHWPHGQSLTQGPGSSVIILSFRSNDAYLKS